jgi:hypothetical protein
VSGPDRRDVDPWEQRPEGSEFLERSRPAAPHVRLVALVIVAGMVASSGYVVLSLLLDG